jgi:DHA2 family multidrug resistance protein
MPLSQTLLLRIFPKDKAAAATALWAMTTLIAPVVGPILGGWICDNFDWPVIFFINVPLALMFAPTAWRMLRRYEMDRVRAPIDVVGLALLVVFVGALQLMLDLGKDRDWFASRTICALAVVSAIGFAAFLIWELTERHPIVDLRVFRHRGYAASVVTIALGFGAYFAANVLTPLWLQGYMGYTATWAGLTTAWCGVLAVFMAPVAGTLIGKVDPRRLIFFGLVWLAMVNFWRTGSTTDMGYWEIAHPLILSGIGLPFFFVPLTALALGNVEEAETASAAGLMNFLRTLSGAIATSIVTTSWENGASAKHAELAGLLDRGGELWNSLMQAHVAEDAARVLMDRLVQGQSVMLATNGIMLCVVLAFAVSAMVIWIAPRPSRAVDLSQAGH